MNADERPLQWDANKQNVNSLERASLKARRSTFRIEFLLRGFEGGGDALGDDLPSFDRLRFSLSPSDEVP